MKEFDLIQSNHTNEGVPKEKKSIQKVANCRYKPPQAKGDVWKCKSVPESRSSKSPLGVPIAIGIGAVRIDELSIYKFDYD